MMRQMSVPEVVEWMAAYKIWGSERESGSLQDDLEASVESRMTTRQWLP